MKKKFQPATMDIIGVAQGDIVRTSDGLFSFGKKWTGDNGAIVNKNQNTANGVFK